MFTDNGWSRWDNGANTLILPATARKSERIAPSNAKILLLSIMMLASTDKSIIQALTQGKAGRRAILKAGDTSLTPGLRAENALLI